MSESERAFVYRLASEVVTAEAPETLGELETRFEELYENLEPGADPGAGREVEGVPFDLPAAGWTVVSAVVWIAASFVVEALRHRGRRQRVRALRKLEPRLSEHTADPLLVDAVLRQLERLTREVGDLRSLIAEGREPMAGVVGASLAEATDSAQQLGTQSADSAPGASIATDLPTKGGRQFHRAPDLEIEIQLQWLNHERVLEYALRAADPALDLNLRRFVSPPLKKEACAYFAGFFRDIEGLRLDSPQDRETAVRKVASKGSNLLLQLVPGELQRVLWRLRDEVRAVQVQAGDESAAIPWELIRLRPPDGKAGDRPFLCEAFELARWLPEVGKVPSFSLTRPALVVPTSSRLRSAPAERDGLRRLFAGNGRAAVDVPADYGRLLDALAAGEHDCWHFTGHGLARGDDPNAWLIGLDSKEPLRPEDLAEAQGFGASAPLVFLNACYSGRGGFALTTLGGWSSQCIIAGAGAFLGCHWAVPDDKAREFALGFYRRLLAGDPMGQAVRETRLELRDRHRGDPTWLAYTLYADPLAVVAEREDAGERPAAAVAVESPSSSAAGKPPASESQRRAEQMPSEATAAEGTVAVAEADRSVGEPAPAPPQPGEERVHEVDDTVLVFVPGGEYTLGDDDGHEWSRPAHRVLLSPFWIGKVPVTNRQYARFLAAEPEQPRPAFWDDPRFNQPEQPVVGLSWHEAVAYCQWAVLALPSEAQWEAAARGTDQRRYPWGDPPPDLHRANFGNEVEAPSVAGGYASGVGPYGALDQAGNVWEWCADAWDLTAYRGREERELDPLVRGDPAIRAVRGGSWASPADTLEAAFRSRAAAKQRLNDQGFRCLWLPR